MELLNSMHFEDFDLLEDELEYILGDNANKVCAFIARRFSHYGEIAGHNQVGYRVTGSTLVTDIMNTDAEYFRLYTEDDILKIAFYDHDGVHDCEIVVSDEEELSEIAMLEFDEIIGELGKLERIKVIE